MAAGTDQLDDPEGWGTEGMGVYDKLDLAAARKALKEKGRIPWSEVKKELGLK